MEFLNRIKLRGVVGRAEVSSYNGSQVCNFSVVTEYSGVDKEGNSTSEVTWFNVALWNNRDAGVNLADIQKGVWVELTGRLRMRKYTRENGEERSSWDVIARKVSLIPREEDALQPQRDW